MKKREYSIKLIGKDGEYRTEKVEMSIRDIVWYLESMDGNELDLSQYHGLIVEPIN